MDAGEAEGGDDLIKKLQAETERHPLITTLQAERVKQKIKNELKQEIHRFRGMERDHGRKKQEEWAQHEIEEFLRYSQAGKF